MATYRLPRAHSSVLIAVEAEMRQFLCSFWREQDGQDLMEYSLFLCFVALACTAFLGIFHPSVTTIWQVSNNNLRQANNAASPD